MKYIVTFSDDYADEFDVKDVEVISQEYYDFLHSEEVQKHLENEGYIEIYFGSNEFVELKDLSNFTFEKVENEEELNKYIKYFPDYTIILDFISYLEEVIPNGANSNF